MVFIFVISSHSRRSLSIMNDVIKLKCNEQTIMKNRSDRLTVEITKLDAKYGNAGNTLFEEKEKVDDDLTEIMGKLLYHRRISRNNLLKMIYWMQFKAFELNSLIS